MPGKEWPVLDSQGRANRSECPRHRGWEIPGSLVRTNTPAAVSFHYAIFITGPAISGKVKRPVQLGSPGVGVKAAIVATR